MPVNFDFFRFLKIIVFDSLWNRISIVYKFDIFDILKGSLNVPIEKFLRLEWYQELTNTVLGQDSPTLKLCYLSFQLVTFLLKTLLEEKTVIVELGESQPSVISLRNVPTKAMNIFQIRPFRFSVWEQKKTLPCHNSYSLEQITDSCCWQLGEKCLDIGPLVASLSRAVF